MAIKVYGTHGENLGDEHNIGTVRDLWQRMTRLCARFPELTPTSCYATTGGMPFDLLPLIEFVDNGETDEAMADKD